MQENARKGIGRGDESQEPVVKMRGVSIAYKGKGVLHVSCAGPVSLRWVNFGNFDADIFPRC